jgi:glyoxylase-like metal-dependent hydrolase (beta-lactamase superfamily II)
MLQTSVYDGITVYKMGRSMGKYVPYYVHSFLLDDTLIDTGTRYAGAEFLSAIGEKKINRVINTHHHEDHTGNNYRMQQKYSAKIFAHGDAIPYINNPGKLKLRLYQKIIWGYPESSHVQEISGPIAIGNFKFMIIEVQGHSEGHICLYEPEKKWLFTGDMFCGIRNPYLRRDEDFNLMLGSLINLSRLDINTIFCSLKGVVTNGNQALSDKIQYMKNLRHSVFNLQREGLSARQIRDKLLGREDLMFYLTGGHFSKKYLIKNILNGDSDV